MKRYQIPVIDAAGIPMVNFEAMNEVHREEVALINHLGSLITTGLDSTPDTNAITAKLYEWVEHTRAHFDSENRMMEAHGFPPYPVHRAEHELMLSKIESQQQQWLNEKELNQLAEFIFVVWREWFDAHVKSMDTVTARFLSQVM
ncbi:MAG: hemerythrin family protein [Candidatus Thiodiazotropha sp. (ex Dulcina madagascariensis)]|nr:hemerythrin family protein [Candidatus Thiodiazotropha sp. (ex Dulcina madagascariensis)]MCU7925732.1 hemerythrin family protein [Candidatus Thiodiazotropha sp. (ex Dulcina madagascariensis)]